MPRATVARSALLGGTLALIFILVFSAGDVDRMTLSDGHITRSVASHLTASAPDVPTLISKSGTALRYGRIGFPIVLWLAAGGRPTAMRYAQPALMILSAGLAAGATTVLLGSASLGMAALPFLAIGFFLSVVGGFADAFAVSLGLAAVLQASRDRWGWAAILLAAAMLTRENAGAIFVGLGFWLAFRRQWKALAVLSTSLIPVLVWHSIVAFRYGHFPLLDPYLRVTTDALRPPIVATLMTLQHASTASLALLFIHLTLAVIALVLWRRSMYGAIAAAASIQVFMAGPFAWRYIGEATRTLSFLQLFLILALIQVVHDHQRSTADPRASLVSGLSL